MADLASRITQPPAEGDATGAAPAADAQEATPAGGPGLWDSEQNVQVTLSDLQADQNTPFYSATTFKDLNLCVIVATTTSSTTPPTLSPTTAHSTHKASS